VRNKRIWIDLTIVNLCTVAFLGMILRSKILFSLPLINYANLLESHEHFAFSGWLTLALMILMVSELLHDSPKNKLFYQWMFGGVLLTSWCMLFTFYFNGNGSFSNSISAVFIFFTYSFGWIFIKDIRKTKVSKTVLLLSVAAIVCLIISSIGPFALAYLFASKSLNVILYRDALFTFLHFQYNGFFTLSVLALLFNKLESRVTLSHQKYIYCFSILLCISIIPTLFLSYLWQDPNNLLRFVATAGSILVFASFIGLIIVAITLRKIRDEITPITRFIGFLSMSAFALKMFLQSFTIFPSVGNAVFGDRPMIIGFLHLVFLGFVTLFILAYYTQRGMLNIKSMQTKFALVVFTAGVVLNEVVLMGQGLGAMFFRSNQLFPLFLWAISILLFTGTLLLAIARHKSYPLILT
jgi:hypothetical protein